MIKANRNTLTKNQSSNKIKSIPRRIKILNQMKKAMKRLQ
jgi:hypothetical protein